MGSCCSSDVADDKRNNNNSMNNATDSSNKQNNNNNTSTSSQQKVNNNNNNTSSASKMINDSDANTNINTIPSTGRKNRTGSLRPSSNNEPISPPTTSLESGGGGDQKQQQAKRKVDLFLESVIPSFVRFASSRSNFQFFPNYHSNRYHSPSSVLSRGGGDSPGEDNNKPSSNTTTNTTNSPTTTSNATNRKTKLLKMFLKTVSNFVHSTQRTSLEEARRIVINLHPDFLILGDEPVEERSSDDGLARCLEAWSQNNGTLNGITVDCEIAAKIANELEILPFPSSLRNALEEKKQHCPHSNAATAATSATTTSSPPSSPTKRQQQQQSNFPSAQATTTTTTTTASTFVGQQFSFEDILNWYYYQNCSPTTVAWYHDLVTSISSSAVSVVQSGVPSPHNQNLAPPPLPTATATSGTNNTTSGGDINAFSSSQANSLSASQQFISPLTSAIIAPGTHFHGVDLAIVQYLLADGRSASSNTNASGSGGGNNNNNNQSLISPTSPTLGVSTQPNFMSLEQSHRHSAGSATTSAAASASGSGAGSQQQQHHHHHDLTTTKDFLNRHFGGCIVEENFCTFVQNHKSNGCFDSRRVTSVWQDMTQPLPNYLISSTTVSSEDELNHALADNVRCFLVSLVFNESIPYGHATTVTVGGKLPFRTFCEVIRDRGFKKNSFPIIICFPPWTLDALTSSQREAEVANILNETLDPILAKGLMFRGATIQDPEFSPATLRHKVLVMSSQAKLNPFVGLFVADMARTGLGVRVTDIKDGTPAASAGVTRDDWITRINQDTIEDKQHLRRCLSSFRIGDEFTITRENLSHARVVVGAVVDAKDPKHSPSLSNLIFFNFGGAGPHSAVQHENEPDHVFAPWETSVVNEENLVSSPRPVDHLALMDGTQCSTGERGHDEDSVLAVEKFGAQLVDARGSRAAEQWSRGTFVVNGHCGYVLRESSTTNQNTGTTTSATSVFDDSNNNSFNANTADNNNNNNDASLEASTAEDLFIEWNFKLVSLPSEFISPHAFISLSRKDSSCSISIAAETDSNTNSPSVEVEDNNDITNNNNNNDNNNENIDHGHNRSNSSSQHRQHHHPHHHHPLRQNPFVAASTCIRSVSATIFGDTHQISSSHDTRNSCLAHVSIRTRASKLRDCYSNNKYRITITIVFDDDRQLEAVLPANLIRTGLRAVAFRLVDSTSGSSQSMVNCDLLWQIEQNLIGAAASS